MIREEMEHAVDRTRQTLAECLKQGLTEYYMELYTAYNALYGDVDKSLIKKENPCRWKRLDICVKVGYMDPTVFVPVLISDNKTQCICSSIKLYKASISDITLKLDELERSYKKRLEIPVRIVLEPCDYNFAEELRGKGFDNIIVSKKEDSADFYKIFEVED